MVGVPGLEQEPVPHKRYHIDTLHNFVYIHGSYFRSFLWANMKPLGQMAGQDASRLVALGRVTALNPPHLTHAQAQPSRRLRLTDLTSA